MFVIQPADSFSYAYLLGIYLGDGYVANTGRGFQLRHHPRRVCTRTSSTNVRAMSCSAAGVTSAAACDRACDRSVRVLAGSKHWPDLFPQMGPGRKHERPIVLAPWQREIVECPPVALRARADPLRRLPDHEPLQDAAAVRRVAEYAYPRYFFSNLSADIRGLFCASCERLGLRWTQSNHRNISISHRASVALLDENVGPKC